MAQIMKKQDYFPGIEKVKFEGPDSKNPMSFRWYNENQMVGGKKMKDHLPFAVAYWHTMIGTGADIFGPGVYQREWLQEEDPMKKAINTLYAAFQFFEKLGINHYCFHDRDIAPEGKDLKETNKNLWEIVKEAKKLQDDTETSLLWTTSNLFSHKRYTHGAGTNPDAKAAIYAGAQIKTAIDTGKYLGAKNHVFWGGREGYYSLMNTDMKRELDHMAILLRKAKEYAVKEGFEGQFLIEPKPMEPTKHQYDFDSATVLGFLREKGLLEDFKLNVEANHATLASHTFEHDLMVASDAGKLGSVDANHGDPHNGWDTDQFSISVPTAAQAMMIINKQGGIAPGGLNWDAKLRRGSTDIKDMFYAHIQGMDTWALGLLTAEHLKEEAADRIKKRYASYDNGIGKQYEDSELSLVDMERIIMEQGEPEQISGRQEEFEMWLNRGIEDVIRKAA